MDGLPYLNKAVGNVLKALRKKSDFKQRVTADFARTTREQIAQLEAGTRTLNLNTLYKLSQAYNISLTEMARLIDREIEHLAHESNPRP